MPHDTLPSRADIEQRNSIRLAVLAQRCNLLGRHLVFDMKAFVGRGGNVVVDGGEG